MPALTSLMQENYGNAVNVATEQLSRDELLRQRLLAATADCDAVTQSLMELAKDPPHTGADQEERMRGIESNLDSIRWSCRQLCKYKPQNDGSKL